MSVGAGSIKRAAGSAAAKSKTTATPKKAVIAKPVEPKATAEKTVKSSSAKKSAPAKKAAPAKKSTPAKTVAASKTEVKKTVIANPANQAYHITEDLPIYLL